MWHLDTCDGLSVARVATFLKFETPALDKNKEKNIFTTFTPC